MAVEPIRRCGYRKLGGLYLVGGGELSAPCGKLPAPLIPCLECFWTPRQTRSIQRVPFGALVANAPNPCSRGPYACELCPMGLNRSARPVPFMWIGAEHYPTPEDFLAEARELMVSKRIPSIPKWLHVSAKPWIYLAHPIGLPKGPRLGSVTAGPFPAVILTFRLERIEMLVRDDTPAGELAGLRDQGIVPVLVPAGDGDHAPGRSGKKRCTMLEAFRESLPFDPPSADDEGDRRGQ